MAEQVKIGFIGCGGNARGHMNTLNNMEDVKLVALCDLNEERAVSAAEQFDAKAYTDHKVMLKEADLDAMYISIPVIAHGAKTIMVLFEPGRASPAHREPLPIAPLKRRPFGPLKANPGVQAYHVGAAR